MEKLTKPSKIDTAGVTIRLFGELAVFSGDGRPRTLPPSRKTRALLGFLAIAGGEQRRERLCGLFWDAPDDPRGALRWSLSRLRPVLDDAGRARIVADREHVTLDLRNTTSDLTAVRHVIARGVNRVSTQELAEVSRGIDGELLVGLDMPGCPRFHAWLLAERGIARRHHAAILIELLERTDQDPEQAITCARALIALDPLVQSSYVGLLRLLARLGRTSEARQQYDACLSVLREFGQSPSPELVAAHIALMAHSTPFIATAMNKVAAQRGTSVSAGDVGKIIPFVGRASELAHARESVARAASGGGPGVVVVRGESGLGKTRFLAEIQEHVRNRGGLVLAGRGFQAEMVRPYGPWIDALRLVPADTLTPGSRQVLAQLLPELGDRNNAAPERAQLFDALASALGDLASQYPLLLIVLDDLQWSDEASAALLHYVTRSPFSRNVAVMCGVRPGEVMDNPPARRALLSLAKEGRATAINLSALNESDTRTLTRAIGAAIDGTRVHKESGGNPLLAIEIARALGRGRQPLSESLQELIADRLDQLDDSDTQLLPWAAAVGRVFSVDLVARAAGRSVEHSTTVLERLVRLGILRFQQDPAAALFDFVHDVVREVAYRRMSASRRQSVHLQMARILDSGDDADAALAGEIALHAALGGAPEFAARACLRAGERCLRLFAYADAAALADRGIEYAQTLSPQVGLLLRLNLMRLYVHSGLKPQRARDLTAVFGALVEAMVRAGLDDGVLGCFQQIVRLEFYAGQLDAVRTESFRAASASQGADPATAARTLAAAGLCLAWLEKDMPRAFGMLTQADDLARGAGIESADLLVGLGLVRLHEGDVDAAIPLLEKGQRVALRLPDHWTAYSAAVTLVLLDLEAGRAAEALRRCQDLSIFARSLGGGSETPVVTALESVCADVAGDAQASQRLIAAVEALRNHDHKRMLATVLTLLADRDLSTGRIAEARSCAAEALSVAEILGRRSELLMARIMMARVDAAENNIAASREHLDAVKDDLSRPGGASAGVRAAAVKVARTLGISLSLAPMRRARAE